MSEYNHLHVPDDPTFASPSTRVRPRSPHDIDDGLDAFIFNFQPTNPPTLLDIDVANGVRQYPADHPLATTAAATATSAPPTTSMEEQMQRLQQLALDQQKAIEAGNEYANKQAENLQQSSRKLEEAQQTIERLTQAFERLSQQQQQQPQPLTLHQPL